MAKLTLQKSDGTVLSSTLHPETIRQIVKAGHAVVVTPGVSGYDVVKLVTPTLDAVYVAASPAMPVKHVVGDNLFIPIQFPEVIVHS